MSRRYPTLAIPADKARDKKLQKLANVTGFFSINKLLTHVANEVSYCSRPGVFYRALANFVEMSRKRDTRAARRPVRNARAYLKRGAEKRRFGSAALRLEEQNPGGKS